MSIKKTITIGAATANPLTVNRLGYGTMRLPGEHVWGEPRDRQGALQILKTAVSKGVNFLDTADYYGEDVTNRLIAEALYPYPKDLVICSKVGATRKPDKSWTTFDRPENLRTSIENNLKTLKVEQLKLVHFRYSVGTKTPLEESLGAMFELQRSGKILHVGVSCVNADELTKAMTLGNVASVENAFAYDQRTTFKFYGNEVRGLQEVMKICTDNGIPMIPYWSLQNTLPKKDDKISLLAKKYGASPAQVNLAWLLHYRDLMLPIPGTSKLKHLEENIDALDISLLEEDMRFLG